MSVDLIKFGERLNQLRTEKGLSQEKVAQELGYSKGAISFYELGKRTPDIVFLDTAAKYFGVSLDYLMGYTENKTPDVDLKSMCDYMGISEKAVENIFGIAKSYDVIYSYALNLMLSSPQFAIWVYGVRQWLNDLELLEGAIDTLKQKFYEYDEEPPEDLIKCAAEMSLSNPKSCSLYGEARDVMSELDNLNYCEYKLQIQLNKLLENLKKMRKPDDIYNRDKQRLKDLKDIAESIKKDGESNG